MLHIKKIGTGGCSQVFHPFANGVVLLQDKSGSQERLFK